MIAQLITNAILRNNKSGRINSIYLKILYKIRSILVKYNDSPIVTKIGEKNLLLPFSHNLPHILKIYPHYAENLSRLVSYAKNKYRNLTLIDIGANIGDTVALIKKYNDIPILCIEGNESFYKYLESNTSVFSDVKIVKTYVGDTTCDVCINVSEDGGTARILRNVASKDVTRFMKLSDILLNHEKFSKSKFIKIDTDGYDCIIILNEIDFLTIIKPIIFFEFSPYHLAQQSTDGVNVFLNLKSAGYDKALIYDNLGNYMFSAILENITLFNEIFNYYSGQNGKNYCDICVFHSEDSDLFELSRQYESEFIRKLRLEQ